MSDFDSLNLKTLIPLAVGSMLVASGCSPEGSFARKFCKNYKECDEDGFDDEFDSVGECIKLTKLQTKAANYALQIDESPECARAMKKAQVCFAKQLTCDAFSTDDSDYDDWEEDMQKECEDKIDDVVDECNYYDYYDYY